MHMKHAFPHALSALLFCLSLSAPVAAAEEGYPNRTVTIVVPAAAGGGIDFTARLVAGKLQESLGKPFVVENKGAASGTLGTQAVARSAPDGYTLLLTISGMHVTNPALFPSLQLDPVHDFAGVAMVMRAPHVIIVNKDSPVNSLKELVEYARKHPGELTYASPGVGTQSHIASELLGQMANVRVSPVPYRGTGPALNDVLAGTVGFLINTTQSLIGPINGKLVKPLAVTSPTRHPLLPNVPTTAEAGFPGLVIDTWYALYAPAGTPSEAINVLAREINAMSKTEDFQTRVSQSGATTFYLGPQELDKYTATEVAHWTDVIHKLGITAQ